MKTHNFKLTVPLAILITLIAIFYQRATGPTYPKKFQWTYNDQSARFKLPRSQENIQGADILIPLFSKDLQGTVWFKRFPTNDNWSSIEMAQETHQFRAQLPVQPAAGKLQYYVELKEKGSQTTVKSFGTREEPVLIRYKGPVSTLILAPHIFFMFFSMLLSSLAGFEALLKNPVARKVGWLTLGSLTIGGLILGPMVQKSAFGVYWAGFPYDYDLTDNKLLIGVLAWVLAVLMSLKKPSYKWIVAAAIVLVSVYCIPHSTMGSQFNYETNQVETDR